MQIRNIITYLLHFKKMDIIEYEGDWSVCINESEFIFNEEGLEYTILDIQPGREFGKVIVSIINCICSQDFKF